MGSNPLNPGVVERRSSPRTRVQGDYSVEFKVEKGGPVYRFRLWDESAHGFSILVKQDSPVLSVLKVDDVLEMKFFSETASLTKTLPTRIAHITQGEPGRFQGHAMVGLETGPR